MGDFEIFYSFILTYIVAFVIYNIINIFFYKNLFNRFNFFKLTKRDFYECGFKPQLQKPIKLSIQFFLICIFFLIYDIELIFIFPFVSNLYFIGLYNFALFLFFFALFFISLYIDYERHALFWQY